MNPATTWDLLRDASNGDARARSLFANRYEPTVRAALGVRGRSWQSADLEDALQEVFLECLREGGVLDRVRADEVQHFRAFLRGVIEKVALRFDERRARRGVMGGGSALEDADPSASSESLALVLDRAWARTILREAADEQAQTAKRTSPDAERRVELLRLRFHEGLAIRDIAARWGEDAARLHHEFARARDEYLLALETVVSRRYPGTPEAVKRVCGEILELVR